MNLFPQPRLLVSRCLGFAACRWNGEMISDPFVDALGHWVEYVTLCPEMEVGLGVPRDPVRLVEDKGGVHMRQPATGRDLTAEMTALARRVAEELPQVEGLLLKSRSPSCGPQDVKIYSADKLGSASRRGSGLFAGLLMRLRPGLAVEHEGRVQNFHLREHFLTRIFAMARFRELGEKPTVGGLVRFQAANKLLLMAYHQQLLRRMGRVVANPEDLAVVQLMNRYGQLLRSALARPPRAASVINVLMHALGYFKKGLNAKEKAYFLDLLTQYRQGRTPLLLLQGVLTAWALRFQVEYLLEQSFFQPYPRELFDLADSGKGRLRG